MAKLGNFPPSSSTLSFTNSHPMPAITCLPQASNNPEKATPPVVVAPPSWKLRSTNKVFAPASSCLDRSDSSGGAAAYDEYIHFIGDFGLLGYFGVFSHGHRSCRRYRQAHSCRPQDSTLEEVPPVCFLVFVVHNRKCCWS